MKNILCYGDSLTYGADPAGGPRHALEYRWPSSLKVELGEAAHVIAEGLGGRTTVHDDWGADGDRNGARILPTMLLSHSPLDLIVIMLGTNDLKPHLGRTASEAGRGMGRLAQIIRGVYAGRMEPAPEMMFVAPPHICATDNQDMMAHFGGLGVIEESKKFAAEYKRRAEEHGAHFFDASTVANPSPLDGVHLDPENTAAIGKGLAPHVKDILGL